MKYNFVVFALSVFLVSTISFPAHACKLGHGTFKISEADLQKNLNHDYAKKFTAEDIDKSLNQSVSSYMISDTKSLNRKQKKTKKALYVVIKEYALIKEAKIDDAYLYPDMAANLKTLANFLGPAIIKNGTSSSGVEKAIRSMNESYFCPALSPQELEQLVENVKAGL